MTRARGAKLKSTSRRELSLADLTFIKAVDDEPEFQDLDFDISKTSDAEDGSVHIEGYINSTEVDDDLDGDIVDARAFEQDLKHFMRHPVIRREHKHPIGTVTRVEFRPEGPFFEGIITHDAPGEQTRDMIRKKVLRGISARFTAKPRPDDVEMLPKDKGRMRVKRARLVEVTVTDVPRNSGGHFKIKEPTRAAFMKSLTAGSSVQPQLEDKKMDFMKLIARLLTDAGFTCNEGDEVSVMKSLGDAISAGNSRNSVALIAKSVGQPEAASADQIIAAIKEISSKDGTVAKSLYDEASTKLQSAEIELLLLKNADRITPANKEFAKSLASTNRDMFETWVKTQDPVPAKPLPAGAAPAGEKSVPQNINITADDIEMAKSFGMTEESFRAVASLKPHEVASKLFGQSLSETPNDKVYAQTHTIPWLEVK